MIPKKIYYENKEIIVSKIWLDNIEIFNGLTPIPKPYWKNASLGDIYLLPYNGYKHGISLSDLAYSYTNQQITIEGTIEEQGERYKDCEYTIEVTPNEGYCWNDGTTNTISLTWMIINIDWADGKNGIYTTTNANEFQIYNDLYISDFITTHLGWGYSDQIYANSDDAFIEVDGNIKSGSIVIKVQDVSDFQSKMQINLSFYIEQLNVSFFLNMYISFAQLEGIVEPDTINIFKYGDKQEFKITYYHLKQILEDHLINFDDEKLIELISNNLTISSSVSDNLFSEDEPPDITISEMEDTIIVKRWVRNINYTKQYSEIYLYFGLNDFNVNGVAIQGIRNDVLIQMLETKTRNLQGPTNISSAAITNRATIGPFTFDQGDSEVITPVISFIDKGQFSNGVELSDVIDNFTIEWNKNKDNCLQVWYSGNDENVNNLEYPHTLRLSMEFKIPEANNYPETTWEFYIEFYGQ